jgi:radical SAM superfamily enzyme YgiQ (UPF0313 family)
MKILLIQPNNNLSYIYKKKSIIDKFESIFFHAPISLEFLKSVTPKKHSVEIVDEKITNVNFCGHYDLVGITAMTIDVNRAYKIADEFRKKLIPVIIGGVHASSLPDEAKQHADSVVIGEAEEIWPKILDDLEHNQLKPFYTQERPTDVTQISFPILKTCNILYPRANTTSSRGCPFGCDYCYSGNSVHGKVYRKRPVSNVVDEIKSVSQKVIFFYDSSMTIDLEHTKNLFNALKGLNKKFICNGNINDLKDDELLMLSKEAGCIQWRIGFESVCQDSLDSVQKKTNRVEEYYKTIKKIHSYGMDVHGYFIFGFDHDSKKIFKETWNFVKKSKIYTASFSILTPLPGTPVYNRLFNEDRLLTKDWSKYNFQKNVVFKPKNMTELELIEGFKWVYSNYYSFSEFIKRFFYSIKREFSLIKVYLFLFELLFGFFEIKYIKNDRKDK